jgi:hypothetical protein
VIAELARGIVAALLVPLAISASGAPADVGEAIYRRGTLPSGQPVKAGRDAGAGSKGADVACANCHGRSGLGAGEGRGKVPPITGRYLLRPLPKDGGDRDIPYVVGLRPDRVPYTDAAIARAIRAGIDSQGRQLDYLMPNYVLDDAQMAALIAYLKRLDQRQTPGVSDGTLHFATIVTPDADPVKRRAMLDVIEQYFADRNARQMVTPTRMLTSGSTARSKSMFRLHRRWELHVWELSGPDSTWQAQLERRLADEPVFAVISGLGGSNWAPVHAFCERAAVPCLFPNVDAPVDREQDFYSLYFSKGVLLEAGLIARELLRPGEVPAPRTVTQVYREGDSGEAGARALAGRLEHAGTVVSSRIVPPGAAAGAVVDAVLGAGTADAIVLWLRPEDLAALSELPPATRDIYLSGLMGGLERAPLSPSWRSHVRMAYPFDLPDKRRVRVDFAMGWFAIRHIPVVAQQVQADTFLACGLLSETMNHMADAISRDYLVERVDEMIERRVITGYYPRLTLGPGQRFASKGGYMVRFPESAGAKVAADQGWSVP